MVCSRQLLSNQLKLMLLILQNEIMRKMKCLKSKYGPPHQKHSRLDTKAQGNPLLSDCIYMFPQNLPDNGLPKHGALAYSPIVLSAFCGAKLRRYETSRNRM